jgi:hypothetical protein
MALFARPQYNRFGRVEALTQPSPGMSLRTTNLPTLTHEELLARIHDLADALQRALEEAQLRRATIETGQPLFARPTLKRLKQLSDELSGTIELAIDPPQSPQDVRVRRKKLR